MNAAFQAACAASDNVYIPAGSYSINSLDPLYGCGILIYGDGSDATVLGIRSVVRPTLWSFAGGYGKSLSFQDLALDGGHSPLAGLSIDGYQSVTLNRVYIHDFGTPGYAAGHHADFDGAYIINIETVQITNSQFTGNERSGVELQAVHYSTMSNSVMSGNGRLGGVSEQNFVGALDGPLLAEWFNNTVSNNGSGGIDVETDPNLPAAQAIIKGNQVIDCGNDSWDAGWGLVIGLNSFGTIDGNRVENFAAQASRGDYTSAIVYGLNGGPISITNNVVSGTKSYGIVGDSSSFPINISGNTLLSNGTGIFIYLSPGVQILQNTINNSSGPGIAVYWSDPATISGNQFADNLIDVLVNGRQALQQ
jgi:parallel beta-helix repeat protein